MFIAEARGLAWLGEAKALRVPAVVAASGANDVTPFLALEMIKQAPRARNFDERLGRGLAALHRHGARAFGLDHDNYVGRLPQANKFGRHVARVLPGAAPGAAAQAGGGRRARVGADAARVRAPVRRRWKSCAGRPSRRRACTATCGAAT